MAGTKEGALKTKQKNLKRDPDFYRKIGAKSWKSAQRSHKVGFALLDKETHIAVSALGGKKTKNDYKTQKGITNVHIIKIAEALEKAPDTPETNQISTGTGK